jgi:hypothetical protein
MTGLLRMPTTSGDRPLGTCKHDILPPWCFLRGQVHFYRRAKEAANICSPIGQLINEADEENRHQRRSTNIVLASDLERCRTGSNNEAINSLQGFFKSIPSTVITTKYPFSCAESFGRWGYASNLLFHIRSTPKAYHLRMHGFVNPSRSRQPGSAKAILQLGGD